MFGKSPIIVITGSLSHAAICSATDMLDCGEGGGGVYEESGVVGHVVAFPCIRVMDCDWNAS